MADRLKADELELFVLLQLALAAPAAERATHTHRRPRDAQPSTPLPPNTTSASGSPAPVLPLSTPPTLSEPLENPETSVRVLALLNQGRASFETLEHAPTRTSEESAAVRGVALASGAKAMLLKPAKPLPCGATFVLAVMSAARSLDWPKLRGLVGQPKVSMAQLGDVAAVTGCLPGAVPPFGSLFGGAPGVVATIVDASVLSQGPVINFNAGLRTLSVVGLGVEDYLRIEAPLAVGDFTAPPVVPAESAKN